MLNIFAGFMRRLDTLIIKAFIGPFVLTTVVATFVLLIQYMMKYFDDFVGKDLGVEVFAELLFYFSLNMLQVALPLGVLVSSLMTFGNLGENFELTAIKSAGISLIRALRPIFFFVVVLTFLALEFNNYVVPAANLKAFSLLYDIKHKKPALDLKEGVFYNGIPDYSIKAQEKLPDNKTLKNVLIYDHTSGKGNKRVILADSSKMYTIINDKYLKLELYNGNYYSEEPKARNPVDQLFRTKFSRMDMVFNLSSFDLKRTKEDLFQNNRQMKTISELTVDIDSLSLSILKTKYDFHRTSKSFFTYHMDSIVIEEPEVLKNTDTDQEQDVNREMASFFNFDQSDKYLINKGRQMPDKQAELEKLKLVEKQKVDSATPEIPVATDSVNSKIYNGLDTASWDFLNQKLKNKKTDIIHLAKSQAQNVKTNMAAAENRAGSVSRNLRKYIIEKYKKYSQAFACIVMFLIGAPLGAIIKKGGLGVPVIVSIVFFLIYYIINIICEKSATEGVMNPVLSVWIADVSLLPVGVFFLRQARIDAKLFDTDFYEVWIDRIKQRFSKS